MAVGKEKKRKKNKHSLSVFEKGSGYVEYLDIFALWERVECDLNFNTLMDEIGKIFGQIFLFFFFLFNLRCEFIICGQSDKGVKDPKSRENKRKEGKALSLIFRKSISS